MLLTYSQIDIYPAGYPSSLERTSIHTNQYDNGLFNPHQFKYIRSERILFILPYSLPNVNERKQTLTYSQ